MATLFSYFTKTPKKPSPNEADKAEGKKENTKPKGGAKGVSPPKKNASKSGFSSSPCGVSNGRVVKAELKEYEVVWAKMDGHPTWPSIICNHPTKLVFVEGDLCHVQFFGQPPSRGWVNKKQISPFVKDEQKSIKDPSINDAIREAENALKLSLKERINLIKCVPSDDEDDGDEISDDILMECDLDSMEKDVKNNADDSEDDDEVTGQKVERIPLPQ